jgi:hypothetical protein
MSDREEILKELNQLYTSGVSETPEERLMVGIRIKELLRKLAGLSETSVRVDLNLLGSISELPPLDSGDDEAWRADPYLSFAKSQGWSIE